MSEDIHKFPSQLADRFQVRMPDGLRDRLRDAAAENNRSMNAEIIYRLEGSFALQDYEPDGDNARLDDTALELARALVKRLEAEK